MIKPSALIEKFEYALKEKWGYIYGKTHEIWTEEKQKAVENDPKGREQTKEYGRKWIGRYVTDCSGLFYWAFQSLGGYMYHGSNTMWNKYSTSKGKLTSSGARADGKILKPGSAVYRNASGNDRTHVGLYIGNGEVIEAKGTAYGVVKSKVKGWDEWSELKGVDYNNEEVVIVLKYANVTGGSLNMREEPNTSAKRITSIPDGKTVSVLEETSKDWWKVQYGQHVGYVRNDFLVSSSGCEEEKTDEIKITLDKTTATTLYYALKNTLNL